MRSLCLSGGFIGRMRFRLWSHAQTRKSILITKCGLHAQQEKARAPCADCSDTIVRETGRFDAAGFSFEDWYLRQKEPSYAREATLTPQGVTLAAIVSVPSRSL